MADKRPENEFWLRRWLIRHSTLSAQAKLLLFCLVSYGGDNDDCFVGQEALAWDLSLSDRQLRRLITNLNGILSVKRRGRGSTNLYRIDWEELSNRQQDRTPASGQDRDDRTPASAVTGHLCPVRQDTGVRSDRTPASYRTQREHSIKHPVEQEGGTASAVAPQEIVSAVEVDLVNRWNAIRGLPAIRDMKKRRKVLQSRLQEDGWDWSEAIERISSSSFLMGKNDRGWRANIDWFLKPNIVTRILEGNYDDQNGNGADHSGLMKFVQSGEEK